MISARFRLWRARRRWWKERPTRNLIDQLATEATMWMEQPEPTDLGHWRTVELGRPAVDRDLENLRNPDR